MSILHVFCRYTINITEILVHYFAILGCLLVFCVFHWLVIAVVLAMKYFLHMINFVFHLLFWW